jgi:hypothetical protein
VRAILPCYSSFSLNLEAAKDQARYRGFHDIVELISKRCKSIAQSRHEEAKECGEPWGEFPSDGEPWGEFPSDSD